MVEEQKGKKETKSATVLSLSNILSIFKSSTQS